MQRPNTTVTAVFLCWLAIGATIELLGHHLGLYAFRHPSGPWIVAILLFGLAVPLLQMARPTRPSAFAATVLVGAIAIEGANAIWLDWWQFHKDVRSQFTGPWDLAAAVSAPLFPIALLMGVAFPRRAGAEDHHLVELWSFARSVDRRLLAYAAVCVATLVAFGRYGNADYLLHLSERGNLALTAPLEPRPPSHVPTVEAALGVFAVQAAIAGIALVLARPVAPASWARLGCGPGVEPWRSGLSILVVLTVAPLPGFILAGLDPHMAANYPLVRPFDGPADFLLFQAGYLLFFLTMEVVFRSILFAGLAEALTRSNVGLGLSERNALIVAGLTSSIAYVAWHLGKPVPELSGAVVWGPLACLILRRTGSLAYLVIPHWLWNVVLDGFVALSGPTSS